MQIDNCNHFGEVPELANGPAWKAGGVKAARGRNSLSPPRGLAERLIALASKARGRKSSRGSNPLPSASYYVVYRITVIRMIVAHVIRVRLSLYYPICSCGEIGIHNRLKICRLRLEGSSPSTSTIF